MGRKERQDAAEARCERNPVSRLSLVGADGAPTGSDAALHAELVRAIAMLSMVSHDVALMSSTLARGHAVLAEVGAVLIATAASHGLKPTKEEVRDAILALKNGMNGAAPAAPPQPPATPSPPAA